MCVCVCVHNTRPKDDTETQNKFHPFFMCVCVQALSVLFSATCKNNTHRVVGIIQDITPERALMICFDLYLRRFVLSCGRINHFVYYYFFFFARLVVAFSLAIRSAKVRVHIWIVLAAPLRSRQGGCVSPSILDTQPYRPQE